MVVVAATVGVVGEGRVGLVEGAGVVGVAVEFTSAGIFRAKQLR